jgi:hypothetical protein
MDISVYLLTHSWLILIIVIWTIPWKGVALWRAAQRKQVVWFIILLIMNTLAILDILYIFAFSRKKKIPGDNKEIRKSKENASKKKALDINKGNIDKPRKDDIIIPVSNKNTESKAGS